MRLPHWISRLRLAQRNRRIAVLFGVMAAALLVSLFVAYPVLGEWMIRRKIAAQLQSRFGGEVSIASVDVSLGHAVIKDIRFVGGRIGTLDVEFSALRSLVGSLQLENVAVGDVDVTMPSRTKSHEQQHGQPTAAHSGRLRALLKGADIQLANITVRGSERGIAATLTIDSGHFSNGGLIANGLHGTVTRGTKTAKGYARSVSASETFAFIHGAVVEAHKLEFRPMQTLVVRDGESIVATSFGNYASAPSLWSATAALSDGHVEATLTTGELQDKLLVLSATADDINARGRVDIAGIELAEPWLASHPVTDIGGDFTLDMHFSRKQKTLQFNRLDGVRNGAKLSFTGGVRYSDGLRIDVDITVPPVACDKLLHALPSSLIPKIASYQLAGQTSASASLVIDGKNGLAELTGSNPLADCSVANAPADSPTKLKTGFTHRVETAPGQYTEFIVGGKNRSFVDYDSIPEFVVKSIVATEDPTFMDREGFEAPGLARALAHTIKNRSFSIGGSSIPMQLAKNLFLSGERTLSRKLQELVLAWHMETTISRYKLIEIYLNIIEFGPGLYGISPATRTFFGKSIQELMPVDAAYFSAIVPRPRISFSNYCSGKPDKETLARMQRALTLMVNAGYITAEEWDAAAETQLTFRDVSDRDKCLQARTLALTAFESR